MNPILPPVMPNWMRPAKQEALPIRPHSSADYEIWLAADGAMQGVWYETASAQFGPLTGLVYAGTSKDTGEFSRIIHRAVVPSQPNRPRVDTMAYALRPFVSQSLKQLCLMSQAVVTGRVVGILREGHTPVNSENSFQHTVYVVSADDFLMQPANGLAPVIKVWVAGGYLPWKLYAGRHTGWLTSDEPLLDLGQRYCLFLKMPKDEAGAAHRRGYWHASIFGISGMSSELDEYLVADPLRGKLLLQNGMTCPLPEPYTLLKMKTYWQFNDEGPQILNLPEADVMATIKQAIARH